MKKLIGLMACIMLLGLSSVFAQSKQVTGTVTDMSGLGLPGVSVSIKGTTDGANTDIDGKWALNAKPTDILVISFIGMKTQEIKVGNKTSFTTKLEEDRVAVEEVMVVAYGTQKKGSVAGSVSVVNTEKISDVSVASVDQMLQGKTSGVDIVATSGNPGATAKVVIRGTGSISGSTDPLYVVDGMPINGGMNSVNPNDIASVSTLKDASAVALYGAQAANGVILITTKKGKKGDMKITYSGTYGKVDALVANFNQMNSSELLNYQKNFVKGGDGFTSTDAQYKALEAINTDWKDELLQQGTVQTHNLSVRGGSDKAHFYLGVNNYDEQGVIKKVYFKRNGVTFNADMQGRKWLKVGTNLNIQSTESREARSSRNALNPFNYIYGAQPFEKMYNDDGSFNPTSATVNPLEDITNNGSLSRRTNFMGSAYSNITINKDLSLLSRVGVSRLIYENETFTRLGSHLAKAIGESGKREYYRRYTTYLVNSVLSYNKTLDDIHDFSAKGIVEYQKYDQRRAYLNGSNFASALLDNLASAAKAKDVSSDVSEWSLMSYMANLKYVYDEKYVADLSLRRDGSSRFGTENKYGNFWALGLAWNAHKESFIEDIDAINQLKVRASIGTSGNLPSGNYDHMLLVGYSDSYNDLPAGSLSSFGNPNLKWETTTQTSLGVDFSLFNDRISGTFEVYNKKTTDLLLYSQLSRTTGFSSVLKNIGELSNKGIEFMINTTPIKTDDFQWDLGFNIFTNKTTIDKLAGDDIKSGYNILKEGTEMYAYNMVRYAGVNPGTGQALYYTKDGKITDTYSSADRVVLDKSPFPDFTGNLNTEITYKGVSLGATFYFKQGHYIYNIASSSAHNPSNISNNKNRDLLTDSWRNTGDLTTYPVSATSTKLSSSTLFLEDASYVRLRDLKLSYALPTSLLKRFNIDRLAFSLRGHNLWTYAPNFDGPDPEIGDGGESDVSGFGTVYDYSYPSTASYTFGVEITF